MKKLPTSNGGVSISLAEGAQAQGTLDRLAPLKTQLGLFYEERLLAVGTFDYDPVALEMIHIKKFFEILHESRMYRKDVMLYLGVVISSTVIGDAFVSEVIKYNVTIDTIIFQTYITLKEQYYGGNVDCYTYPISARGHKNLVNNSQPTLSVAEHTVNATRLHGDLFRVVFSSTMGVMVYRNYNKHVNLSRFRQPCDSYSFGDFDLTCSNTSDQRYDETDMSNYKLGLTGDFMLVYEDLNSIKLKMEMYYPRYSDGWCLVDIDRDVYWLCSYKEQPLLTRVGNVSQFLTDLADKPE